MKQLITENDIQNQKLEQNSKIMVHEPSFKPKHKNPLPEKYFKAGYNGFEPKSIEFEMFYNPMQYIGSLNRMLRAGESQKGTTRRTPDNYCIFKSNALRYGDLENRRKIRRDIIRYTNSVERDRGLPKDEISAKIGWIEYRYDKFASEIINEKVIQDALARMAGIDKYMNGRAITFCSFITNDTSRKGLRMRVYVIIK